MLEPYGAGNPEPKLVIKNVRFKKSSIVGSAHVKCFLSSETGGSLKAMAFRVADSDLGATMLASHDDVFDVLGTLRRDTWMGHNAVQFIIEDAKRVTR